MPQAGVCGSETRMAYQPLDAIIDVQTAAQDARSGIISSQNILHFEYVGEMTHNQLFKNITSGQYKELAECA